MTPRLSGAVAERHRAALLALVLLPMLCCLAASPLPLPAVNGGLRFVHWHTLLEFASMLVCGAVATLAWNARELEAPRSVRLLGSACAAALLLDLAHTLSFPGMPDLIGANTPTKTVALFMASRLLIALALLCVAVLPWRLDHEPRWLRAVPALAAAYVALVLAWVFAWPQSMPPLLIEGESLTATKRFGEYALVAIFALAAALFVRRLAKAQRYHVASLLSAAVLMAIGEFTFTLYTRLSDLAVVVGHLYKVLGFWMVYRTIVADSIRAPYERLVTSRQQLRSREDELRTITDNISAQVPSR